MLTTDSSKKADSSPKARLDKRLWYEPGLPMECLGCVACPEHQLCGGLRTRAPLFDCLDLCRCDKPECCDNVCRNNPTYVDRVREVGGFSFDSLPTTLALNAPDLPEIIPMLYHGSCRIRRIRLMAVALPLYEMFDRNTGSPRFESREHLNESYHIEEGGTVILSGTDRDRPLEAWWQFGEKKRKNIIRHLREIGIALATVPNYSLFTDAPRWTDLHAMKRIALVHHEFLQERMPAALHVNGRTETDFSRWAKYLRDHQEISVLSYEFTTGAGCIGRRQQHLSWLCDLAQEVARPLRLVLRGVGELPVQLQNVFAGLAVIDTTAFVKTMNRQRALLTDAQAINWRPEPTAVGAPLDDLFDHNLKVISERFTYRSHSAAA
jgi:hypothetical protein